MSIITGFKDRRLVVFLTVIFLAVISVTSHAARYIAIDVKHSSGAFGDDIRDSVSSLNVSAGITTLKYDAEVTIPFVNRDTEGADSEAGIGDIVVRGGHRLLSNENHDLMLYGSLAAKLATADENAGLGTGENDYGAYLDVYKYWRKQSVSLYGGYRINGDPPDFDLKDVFSYGVGWSRYFTRSSLYFSLEGQQSAIDGLEDPLEFHSGVYHIQSANYLLRGEIFLGLSDGSPDYGLSVGVVRVF